MLSFPIAKKLNKNLFQNQLINVEVRVDVIYLRKQMNAIAIQVKIWGSCSCALLLHLPSKCSLRVPLLTYSTMIMRSIPCSRYPRNLTKYRCSIFDNVKISFLNSADKRWSKDSCQNFRVTSQIHRKWPLKIYICWWLILLTTLARFMATINPSQSFPL